MKCIHCGIEAPRSDVEACAGCGRRFAFKPSIYLDDSDEWFKNAIDGVSGDGTVRFTTRQLWYEINRPWTDPPVHPGRRPFLAYAAGGALPGMAATVFLPGPAAYTLAGAGALAGLGVRAYRRWRERRQPAPGPGSPHIPFDAFLGRYLARWTEVNGPVPGLLPPREAHPAGRTQVPADVASPPPSQVVVTDTWETAAILVANGFHERQGCVVLSLDGYPDGEAQAVKEALRRTPGLTVHALHNATPAGCQLPLTLRQPEWFPDPAVRMVDLGLRPAIAWRVRVPPLPGPPVLRPPLPAWLLSEGELAWLAHGNTAELAALRPAQVLRAAHEGMVAAGPHVVGGMRGEAGTIVVDGFG
jgi:hypothetical protein